MEYIVKVSRPILCCRRCFGLSSGWNEDFCQLADGKRIEGSLDEKPKWCPLEEFKPEFYRGRR